MRRVDRIRKLGIAIKEYKGSKNHIDDKDWQRAPKPSRLDDIKRHLTALYEPQFAATTVKRKVREAVTKIETFKVITEYESFIRGFYNDKEETKP